MTTPHPTQDQLEIGEYTPVNQSHKMPCFQLARYLQLISPSRSTHDLSLLSFPLRLPNAATVNGSLVLAIFGGKKNPL
jgi:hypothetical protein